jgi:hypothetical protein
MVARYLTAVAHEEPSEVSSLVDAWMDDSRHYLSAWQRLWLLEPFLRINLGPATSKAVLTWMDESEPSLLRTRAALVLATENVSSVEAVASLYHEVPRAARPDAVAALALLTDGEGALARSIERDSPVNRAIFRWVSHHGTDGL